ncbi:MAG: sensor histidine kinase, partial [Rhodospirillales bacterium]
VALKRALRNLIENALRYGGSARVSLTQDGAQAVITVTDQGPGLPEDQLERAFEPFVRMETSRATETGGVGLGLAIARGLVRAMGGDITLANRAEGGLVAKVTLPV